MKKSAFLLVFTFALLHNSNGQFAKCTVTGKVTGRSSSSIILMTMLEDPRFARTYIPITDGSFTFEINANPIQAYWLVFQDELASGGLTHITIFPDKEKIQLLLYDNDHSDQNKIYGGELNRQYALFSKKTDSIFTPLTRPYYKRLQDLMDQDNYFSQENKALNKRIKETQNRDSLIVLYKKSDLLGDRSFTKPVLEINKSLDSIFKERYTWCYNYYDQNPGIVSYSLLMQDLLYFFDPKYSDLKRMKKLQEKFSSEFPGHPYNLTANDRINSFDRIKPGGEFIDFTLPDLLGKNLTLSNLIKDKIALIDLWATWCVPCIATSRSMIPVYNEFKNKGFTIVGVASEQENTDQLKSTIDREKFPWINLVELDNKNRIWTRYGIPNSGGGIFLIDRKGKILAINPTAQEVRDILMQKLK